MKYIEKSPDSKIKATLLQNRELGKLERLLNNIRIDEDRSMIEINGEEIYVYPHLPSEGTCYKGLFIGCVIVLLNIAPEITKAVFNKLGIKIQNKDGEDIDWDKFIALN